MTNSDKCCNEQKFDERYLELGVPILSFGATLIGVAVWHSGREIGFQYFSIGCVIASCLLAYLAWIRPRKDIVALSTPVYAFVFFVVPTDFESGLVLQMLYAASLTLLLVRLKRRFGASHASAASGKELSVPLMEYVVKTHDAFSGTTPETGHTAAMVISQFAFGEYGIAARSSASVTSQPEGTGRLLARSFEIVYEQAIILERSEPRPVQYLTFSPEFEALLAKVVPLSGTDDRKFDTTLDNALLLLFSAAWNASEGDRSHLIACQGFLMKLIAD